MRIKSFNTLLAALFVFSTGYGQKVPDPTRFEESVVQYEQHDQQHPFPEGAVLFVGSSSVRMWKSIDQDLPSVKAINRGFGGSQFSDLLYYLDRLVTCYKPSKIFIYEGDNDIASGKKPKEILNDAKQVRQKIATALPGIPVYFIAAKPSVARWNLRKKYQQLNSLLAVYASNTPATGFVNVWDPALNEDGTVRTDIFLEDNLHMNEKGYAIWTAAIEPFL
jgi:lysophospholipase L1-like esterase